MTLLSQKVYIDGIAHDSTCNLVFAAMIDSNNPLVGKCSCGADSETRYQSHFLIEGGEVMTDIPQEIIDHLDQYKPKDSSWLLSEQSPVTQNDKPHIWDLVIEDMANRDRQGVEKYGSHLQPDNGRDPLLDAYQEALDLAVYLRQELYERYGK